MDSDILGSLKYYKYCNAWLNLRDYSIMNLITEGTCNRVNDPKLQIGSISLNDSCPMQRRMPTNHTYKLD